MAKKRSKVQSKYYMKYGRSIPDMHNLIGWSVGTIHAYLQIPGKRKELFAEIERVLKGEKV